MKLSNDPFEKQVQSLYDGYEVPAPASAKDKVFNELNTVVNNKRIQGYVNKAVIATAAVVLAFFWISSPSEVEMKPLEVVTSPTKPAQQQNQQLDASNDLVDPDMNVTTVLNETADGAARAAINSSASIENQAEVEVVNQRELIKTHVIQEPVTFVETSVKTVVESETATPTELIQEIDVIVDTSETIEETIEEVKPVDEDLQWNMGGKIKIED